MCIFEVFLEIWRGRLSLPSGPNLHKHLFSLFLKIKSQHHKSRVMHKLCVPDGQISSLWSTTTNSAANLQLQNLSLEASHSFYY